MRTVPYLTPIACVLVRTLIFALHCYLSVLLRKDIILSHHAFDTTAKEDSSNRQCILLHHLIVVIIRRHHSNLYGQHLLLRRQSWH